MTTSSRIRLNCFRGCNQQCNHHGIILSIGLALQLHLPSGSCGHLSQPRGILLASSLSLSPRVFPLPHPARDETSPEAQAKHKSLPRLEPHLPLPLPRGTRSPWAPPPEIASLFKKAHFLLVPTGPLDLSQPSAFYSSDLTLSGEATSFPARGRPAWPPQATASPVRPRLARLRLRRGHLPRPRPRPRPTRRRSRRRCWSLPRRARTRRRSRGGCGGSRRSCRRRVWRRRRRWAWPRRPPRSPSWAWRFPPRPSRSPRAAHAAAAAAAAEAGATTSRSRCSRSASCSRRPPRPPSRSPASPGRWPCMGSASSSSSTRTSAWGSDSRRSTSPRSRWGARAISSGLFLAILSLLGFYLNLYQYGKQLQSNARSSVQIR